MLWVYAHIWILSFSMRGVVKIILVLVSVGIIAVAAIATSLAVHFKRESAPTILPSNAPILPLIVANHADIVRLSDRCNNSATKRIDDFNNKEQ